MKHNKNLRKSVLVFLLILPIIMLFGMFLITDAQARENIPILPDPRNNWHWHDDVKADTLIIFETEYRLNTPHGAMYSRFLEMANITGFENKTRDFMGSNELFSNVLGQQCFYNVTSKAIETTSFTFNISSFQFKSGRPPGPQVEAALLISEGQWIPSIVPINSTSFNASIMGPIFGLTYWIAASQGQMNSFDSMGSNPAENRVWLSNSTDGYYINCTYFNNGTLNTGEAFVGVNNGMGGLMNASVYYKRVFNYNCTKEIEWGFNEGDVLYYGMNEVVKNKFDDEYQYNEVKIEIVDITTENILVNFMYPLWQDYQFVYANVSFWNSTTEKYELKEGDEVVGIANDLIPFNLMALMGDDLSKAKGDLIEANLNVTDYWDFNFTVGPLPNNNNNTWGGTIMEMLDGFNGNPTGVYFVIDHVEEGIAGSIPDADNLTLVLDREYMEGDLYEYNANGEFDIGQYFNIYNATEDEGPLFTVFPKDISVEDIQFIYNNETVKMMGFEEVIYPSEHEMILQNASAGSYIDSVFDLATGLPVHWTFVNSQTQSCMFRKNSTVTNGNLYDQEMWAERTDSVTAQLNLTVNGALDVEVYWALLDFNPTLKPLERVLEQMSIYIEVYTNNSLNVPWRNVTICYDETILNNLNIPETSLSLFYFDNTTFEWFEIEKMYYTIDTVNNKIYVPIPQFAAFLYLALGTDKRWSWAVNEGERLEMFMEGMFYNLTDSTQLPIVEYTVYNITEITTEPAKEEDVLYPDQTMEYIHQTQLVWNLTEWQVLEEFEEWSIIAFGENASDSIPLKIVPGEYAGIPYVVPLRYGSLNLTEVAIALMDSFYVPFGAELGIPYWNEVNVDEVKNIISFTNNSGYWLNLTYFENNGTIKEASGFITVKMGVIYEMEFTINRNYVKNQSSDVSWGVEEGETLYYGDEVNEKMYEVFEINSILVNLYDAGLMPWPSYQIFSTVWADKCEWNKNTETWDYAGVTLIGIGNNHIVGAMGNIITAVGSTGSNDQALFPEGTTGTDLADQISEYMDLLPELDVVESSNSGYFRVTGAGGYYMEGWLNDTTGIIEFIRGQMTFGFFSTFRKTLYSMPAQGVYYRQDIFNSMTFDMEFTITANIDCLFRFFNSNANPTRTTDGIEGTIIFFSDMMITNHSRCNTITTTVTLPTSIDLDKVYIRVWTYNASNEMWSGPSIQEILSLSTIDYANNKITMSMPLNDPLAMIAAWSWVYQEEPTGDDDDDSGGDDNEENPPSEIPGYDFLFLFATIALTSLVIIKKRFK